MRQSKVIIHTDGGARGNPGPAAIGVVVLDAESNILELYMECIGDATNNIAEYRGLIRGLELASEHTNAEVMVNMDSELVIRQMIGEYKVKQEHLIPLHEQAKELARKFAHVTYIHVPREDAMQEKANQLVNDALDGKQQEV